MTGSNKISNLSNVASAASRTLVLVHNGACGCTAAVTKVGKRVEEGEEDMWKKGSYGRQKRVSGRVPGNMYFSLAAADFRVSSHTSPASFAFFLSQSLCVS